MIMNCFQLNAYINFLIVTNFFTMGKKTFKRKLNPNPQQALLYDKVTFAETKIIQKINKLKKTKSNFNLCDHLHTKLDQNQQQYDPKLNYYDKYWKQYLMALSLMKKVNQFQEHVQKVEHSLKQIEKKFTQRQHLLNEPALAKIKKPIQKGHHKADTYFKEQEIEPLHENCGSSQLKKEEDIEPQFINYHHQQQFDNQIFDQ